MNSPQTRRRKVILVNPGIHFQGVASEGVYPNTALMVLATILHGSGFAVSVVDGRYQRPADAVGSILAQAGEDLVFVGFSVMTIQLPWAYRVAQELKLRRPETVVVWGGVHPTLFPEQTAQDPAVDIVVINDAAATVARLAAALASGGDLSAVPGLCFKDTGGVRRTAPNEERDTFANVPHIDFSLVDHERYSRRNSVAMEEFYGGRYRDSRVYPVITGLGCAYRCTFCINVILGRKYHFREAGEIVEEIARLRKDHGADFIQPMDENFFINKRRTFEFLELLEKRDLGIRWRPQSRADYFSDSYLDLETARRLDRSGMVVAAMGVESASQEMLDKLKKQLKVEQIVKAMEILGRTSIVPKMNFMAGLPGESEKDIKATFDFAIRLRRMVPRSCVTVSPFRPYPGSPLYDRIVAEYGYRPPSNLADWARLSERDLQDSRGYESFKDYRWIADPWKLEVMNAVYTEVSWYRPGRDDSPLGAAIRAVVWASFRFDFYLAARLGRAFFKGFSGLKRLAKGLLKLSPLRPR